MVSWYYLVSWYFSWYSIVRHFYGIVTTLVCSIEAARLERQEEPLTLRSEFTVILLFPHTHNEGDRRGPTTREIFFLFF